MWRCFFEDYEIRRFSKFMYAICPAAAVFQAARIYTRLFIARSFHRRVVSASSAVRSVLADLLSLYLHYECVDMAAHLMHVRVLILLFFYFFFVSSGCVCLKEISSHLLRACTSHSCRLMLLRCHSWNLQFFPGWS